MTCRHCHEAIRACDCGGHGAYVGARSGTPPHWVLDVDDVRYPSRWCRPASLDRTHEPEPEQT